MRKSDVTILGIILLSFIIGMYLYPQMPQKMASHWNAQGQVDGYMPKFWGLFLIPFTLVGLFLLFIVIPKIDPLNENIKKFSLAVIYSLDNVFFPLCKCLTYQGR